MHEAQPSRQAGGYERCPVCDRWALVPTEVEILRSKLSVRVSKLNADRVSSASFFLAR